MDASAPRTKKAYYAAEIIGDTGRRAERRLLVQGTMGLD